MRQNPVKSRRYRIVSVQARNLPSANERPGLQMAPVSLTYDDAPQSLNRCFCAIWCATDCAQSHRNFLAADRTVDGSSGYSDRNLERESRA